MYCIKTCQQRIDKDFERQYTTFKSKVFQFKIAKSSFTYTKPRARQNKELKKKKQQQQRNVLLKNLFFFYTEEFRARSTYCNEIPV